MTPTQWLELFAAQRRAENVAVPAALAAVYRAFPATTIEPDAPTDTPHHTLTS